MRINLNTDAKRYDLYSNVTPFFFYLGYLVSKIIENSFQYWHKKYEVYTNLTPFLLFYLKQTFRKPIEAKVSIGVLGAVNGFKLSDLEYDMSALRQQVVNQSAKLQDLYMQLANAHTDNLQLSCGK